MLAGASRAARSPAISPAILATASTSPFLLALSTTWAQVAIGMDSLAVAVAAPLVVVPAGAAGSCLLMLVLPAERKDVDAVWRCEERTSGELLPLLPSLPLAWPSDELLLLPALPLLRE